MRESLIVVGQTTPAAPAEERDHFIDGVATPPNLGGEWEATLSKKEIHKEDGK